MPKCLLRDIATIQSGYHAKNGISEDLNAPYRLLQSKDLDFNKHFKINYLTTFSPERKPEPYLIHKYDVLFQSRGTSHFAFCIEEDLKNVLVGGSFYILRVKLGNLLSAYLAWWLNQPYAQTYFRLHARESRISFVPKSALSRLPVKVPPLPVQKKIVKIEELQRSERELTDKLLSARARLARAACMMAIGNYE